SSLMTLMSRGGAGSAGSAGGAGRVSSGVFDPTSAIAAGVGRGKRLGWKAKSFIQKTTKAQTMAVAPQLDRHIGQRAAGSSSKARRQIVVGSMFFHSSTSWNLSTLRIITQP